MAQADLVVAARALCGPMVRGEDDERAPRPAQDVRPALRARPLLEQHELAALVVHVRLREDGQHLEREVDVAVEILVQRVPVALAVAQDERRPPLLPARGSARAAVVLERKAVGIAAEQRRPLVGDRREVTVECAAQPAIAFGTGWSKSR